ncbi:MAG: hypothetical protein HFH79_07900 [Lachnospiraceae bacterium]|nr:hypothetical protein [Lachnospiraceae bacterium]
MTKLAVIVLMASISLTACGSKAVNADNMEVVKNIEETSTIVVPMKIGCVSYFQNTTSKSYPKILGSLSR